MSDLNILDKSDECGAVPIIADLHFKFYFWNGSDPSTFHKLVVRLRQTKLGTLTVAGDLSGKGIQNVLIGYPDEELAGEDNDLARVCVFQRTHGVYAPAPDQQQEGGSSLG